MCPLAQHVATCEGENTCTPHRRAPTTSGGNLTPCDLERALSIAAMRRRGDGPGAAAGRGKQAEGFRTLFAAGRPGDAPGCPPETPPDVPPDTPPDVPPETPPDVPPETPPDVPPETPPDVPPETPPDVPPETPPGCPLHPGYARHPGYTGHSRHPLHAPGPARGSYSPEHARGTCYPERTGGPGCPRGAGYPEHALDSESATRTAARGRGGPWRGGRSQQSGSVTEEQTTVTAAGSSAGALPFTGAESLLLTLLLGLTALGLGAGLRKAVQSRP